MKNIFTILLIGLFVSCVKHKREILISPSGMFKILIEVNENKYDSTKYLCLKFTLLDEAKNRTDSLQTYASYTMAWSVNWHPEKDIIILNSHDIGTYAWTVSANNKITPIELTVEIDSLAKFNFEKKYKDD